MTGTRRLIRAALFSLLVLTAPLAAASDTFQRSVAVAQAFVPMGLLLAQGTDTPLEIAAFGGAALLQSAPNVLMLMAERAAMPQLTRTLRLVNFGIDCAIGAGALGAGVAAYADSVPYAVETP